MYILYVDDSKYGILCSDILRTYPFLFLEKGVKFRIGTVYVPLVTRMLSYVYWFVAAVVLSRYTCGSCVLGSGFCGLTDYAHRLAGGSASGCVSMRRTRVRRRAIGTCTSLTGI